MIQTLTLEMDYEDVEFTVISGETLALRYSDENDSHTRSISQTANKWKPSPKQC